MHYGNHLPATVRRGGPVFRALAPSLVIASLIGALTGCAGHQPRGLGALADQAAVVGHRGAAGLAPENTLPAFEAAVELGVAFELDVTLSADGEVVVIHDDSVDRTTDGQGEVRELPWSTLAALDAGSWLGPEWAGTRLPTLDQVLDAHAGRVLIDIELKTTPDRAALAEAVVASVRAHDAVEDVVVTSFDPYLLGEVADREPGILRGQLTSTFKDADLSFVQKVVLRHVGLKRVSRPDFIAVEHVRASRRYVRRWHRRGYPVVVYTVNDAERMKELLDNGVDGIITDRPDLALQVDGGPR